MSNIVKALIEIPMGSKNKYEVDKDTNRITLDRVLYSEMRYPAEYGYIENTLAEDNDPLDILVLVTEPTFPGCVVESRILGYLEMIDDGEVDHKLIAVNQNDPRYDHIKSLKDISPHILREIKHFFSTYKDLQNKKVVCKDFVGEKEAIELLNNCIKAYKK